MTSPDVEPEPTSVPVSTAPAPDAPVAVGPAHSVSTPAARVASVGGPVLPEQSREDTDAAWGDYPEPANDRLYRDRPPHWDDH